MTFLDWMLLALAAACAVLALRYLRRHGSCSGCMQRNCCKHRK